MSEPSEFWENPERIKLACYEWLPENPKFILYLVHGYADHSNAYPKLIKEVNSIGGAVYSHEHFAHGKSGPYDADSPFRCQIKSLEKTARDVYLRLGIVRQRHDNLKAILYGHSLGGLISSQMLLTYPESKIFGVILEAAAFQIHPDSGPWYVILGAKVLNFFLPNMKVGKVEFHNISRNESVNKQKEIESKHFGDNGGMTASTAVHMLNVQQNVINKLDKISFKTFIATGSHDALTSRAGSELAHEKMSNSTLMVYDGAYHALHDELEETTNKYLADVINFIQTCLD